MSIMKTRRLATTDIYMSEITFGGASISGEGGGYGFGEIAENQAIKLLHGALDRGIHCFDTAPIYGFGLSEKRMGKAFKDRRESVFLISKSGVSWHENKRVNMTNDPVIAEKMLHQSLIDLQTDVIDLYMVHWPDKNIDIRDTLRVYKKAQDAGKIKYIGLCNTYLEDLEKAREVCDIKMVQSQFHWFDRGVTQDLFPYLKQHQKSFMSWSTLGQGIISGRVQKDRKYDQSDARSWAPWWNKDEVNKKVEMMNKLQVKLQEYNKTGLHLAISFNLSFSELTTALVGVRSLEQLDSLINAYNNLLNNDELASIQGLYDSLKTN